MAKQTVKLANLLQSELKRMSPAQVSAFRRELVKVLPQTIKSAADVARKEKSNGGEK